MTESMSIATENLSKRFGATQALNGLSVQASPGSVLGLLGPNGAGKTTAVRILATLLRPSSGRAYVCGVDVAASPRRVRPLIAVTGQFAAVDDMLTGRENLELVGRLCRLPRVEVRRRVAELLERVELTEAAGKQVKTYSGGMRRRLDLAASLIGRPQVLFLDEPTTGLDLRSRLSIWSVLEDLTQAGTTVLLTTQYLEEADRISDVITVVNHGRTIATGTPDELKAQVGGERAELHVADPAQLTGAVDVVRQYGEGEPSTDDELARVTVPLSRGGVVVPEILRDLDAAGVSVVDLAVRRPTLDDVFLSLTDTTYSQDSSNNDYDKIVKTGKGMRS